MIVFLVGNDFSVFKAHYTLSYLSDFGVVSNDNKARALLMKLFEKIKNNVLENL